MNKFRKPPIAQLCVAMVAVVLGVTSFFEYWDDPGVLWRDPLHDRNTHYLNGLNLSLDLAGWDLPGFFADLTADPIWPPLNALVLAVVLTVGGPDHRLAIVPGLLGWSAAILLTWSMTYRVAAAIPSVMPGWFAATVAAALALASPAFRYLGADVMLEGLGAALGAAVLQAFIRSEAMGFRTGVHLLAILLTGLFLQKFNYWLLIVAALSITLALDPTRRQSLSTGLIRLSGLARQAILSAPGLSGLAAWLAAIVLSLGPPFVVSVMGRGFQVFPGLLLTAGWGCLLCAVCMTWRRQRAIFQVALSPPALIIARWHALPVALWFLVPNALGRFLWFVSPTHRGANMEYAPWRAVSFQWSGFAEGFHTPVIAIPVLVLALTGGVALARRPGGGRCIPIFAAISSAALVLHPQQQWRFQATMLFAIWVCAGIGTSAAVAAAARASGVKGARLAIPLTACLALLAVQPIAPLASRAAIRSPDDPSDLGLAAAYTPLVRGTPAVAVITTFGLSDLFAWTIREACRCRLIVDQFSPLDVASPNEAAARADEWIDRSPARTLLLVDARTAYEPPGQPGLGQTMAGIPDMAGRRPGLIALPGTPVLFGSATISAWQLSEPRPTPLRRLRLDVFLSGAFAVLAVMILLAPKSAARV